MTTSPDLTAQDDLHINDKVSAIRKGATTFGPLCHLSLINLSGPDAMSFLQNRCTNDVAALNENQGCHNTVLNKKAQIQATFTTHKIDDQLLLLSDKIQTERLISHLKQYHILEKVSFTDMTDDLSFFTVQGIDAAELLTNGLAADEQFGLTGLTPLSTLQTKLWNIETTIIKKDLTGEGGYVLWVNKTDVNHFETALTKAVQNNKNSETTVLLTPELLNLLRVEAGLLHFGLDYNNQTLLPETGLEQTTVSYTKGCYLGQETVARVKTYGSVQNAMIGLSLQPGVSLPAVNQTLFIEGSKVGQLKSVIDSPTLGHPIGLAYLHKDFRAPGKQLSLQIGNAYSEALPVYDATVTLLPFYTSHIRQQQAQTLLKSGLSAFAEGDDTQAITDLRQALAIDSSLYDAYEALGVILSRQQQFEEAINLMHKLAEADPERIMAHTNLSVFYMKIGDIEKAEDEKAKATVLGMRQKAKEAGLTISPEAEQEQKRAATQQRIGMFHNALKHSPDDPLGNFGLASAYVELEEYEQAIEPFQKTLAAQPNHSACYLSLGKTYEALNRYTNAIETYQQGIEIASKRRDLMPLNDMQQRLKTLLETEPAKTGAC